MTVNSHLKIPPTKATAGLEGLQAASRHTRASARGCPAPRGSQGGGGGAGRGGGTGGAGRLAPRGRGLGHSASQRPERRKPEPEPEELGQRPSARERRGGLEAERARGQRSARPPSRGGVLPDPRGLLAPDTAGLRSPLGLASGPQPFCLGSWAAHTPLPSPPGVQELIPGPEPTFSKGRRTPELLGSVERLRPRGEAPSRARQ